MPIKPKKSETQKDFVKRCIPKERNAGKGQEQAVAICFSIYDRNKK